MNKVPERKKLRQEYLRKRSKAYARIIAASLLLLLVPFTVWICYLLALDCYRSNVSLPPGPMHGKTVAFDFEVIVTLLGVTITIPTFLIWRGIVIVKQACQDVRLSSISPSFDALPAEEALVRGSEEPPVAQSEVLLRAAQGVETPKEELLRVSQESRP